MAIIENIKSNLIIVENKERKKGKKILRTYENRWNSEKINW